MTSKRYLATMAYSDSDDNDLFITQNSFSLGPSIRTAYLAAEDLLNIGLDDLENDYNISNNCCILILS